MVFLCKSIEKNERMGGQMINLSNLQIKIVARANNNLNRMIDQYSDMKLKDTDLYDDNSLCGNLNPIKL